MSGLSSRRSVLQALLATGALRTAKLSSQQPSAAGWLLLGTNQGKGIYRARWDAVTGTLGAPELAAETPKPSFLTLHPRLPVLYACNEDDDSQKAAVSAFAVDRRTATLTLLATQPTHGADPCYVSVDRTGQLLFAANYGGGSLTAFPLDGQGKPAQSSAHFACAGNPACGTEGPVKDRQDASHFHCALLSPDNRYVLVCDLGNDSILIFPIHPGATPSLGEPTRFAAAPGAGPRHVTFQPNGQWLYCVNELNCTVVQYRWSAGNPPRLEAVADSVANIRPPHTENIVSTGAEITITRDGRFAYTSTRFSDVLTVFSIDATSGRLTQIQQLPCGGKTPRFFRLDPSERWLLSANQDSNTVTVFARNKSTGQLSERKTTPAPNPQYLLWL